MEFTKKVDPPNAHNNTALFDKAVAAGKDVIVIQGYKYVLSSPKTLIPQFGIIAKLKDFHPFNKKTRISGNVNMNRFYAYAEAMYWLYDHNPHANPIKSKKEEKLESKLAAEKESYIESLKAQIAEYKKAGKKAKSKKPAPAAKDEGDDPEEEE